jgi:hypothetical protein
MMKFCLFRPESRILPGSLTWNILQVPLCREALWFAANLRQPGVKCVAGPRPTGNKCSAKDQRAASERLTARW